MSGRNRNGFPSGGGGLPPRGGGGAPSRGGRNNKRSSGAPPGGRRNNEEEGKELNIYPPPPTFGRLKFKESGRPPLSPIGQGRNLFSEFGGLPTVVQGSSSVGSLTALPDEVITTTAAAPPHATLGTYGGNKPEADELDKLVHMDLPPKDRDGNPVPGWCVQTARGPMRFTEPAGGLYAQKDAWLSNIPRIVRPTEPGVYTWIMYTTDGDFTIKFVCKRVYSLYEIGSRHLTIARDRALGPVDRIYGAGELRFDGASIDFNCASGAYMVKLLKGKVGADLTTHRPSIVEGFRSFFTDIPTFDNSDTVSFLTNYAFAPIPEDMLQIYANAGITMTPCSLNSSSAAASSSSAAAVRQYQVSSAPTTPTRPRKSHRRRRNRVNRRSTRKRSA